MENGQQLQSPSFSSLATVYIFLFTCKPRTEYQLRPWNKFRAWNILPWENFRDEIFLSENALRKIFHTNYLELKLMQTKIKQITVFHRRYKSLSNQKVACLLYFRPCSGAVSACEWCRVLSSRCIPCWCDCIPDNEEEERQTRPRKDHTHPCPFSLWHHQWNQWQREHWTL